MFAVLYTHKLLTLKTVKWYCNECKENMRRSRNGR